MVQKLTLLSLSFSETRLISHYNTCCCYTVGISWTLYNLAMHPEHQEKCRQEVDAIFSEKEEGEDITRYFSFFLSLSLSLSLTISMPPHTAMT